jgi:hypothetical protein
MIAENSNLREIQMLPNPTGLSHENPASRQSVPTGHYMQHFCHEPKKRLFHNAEDRLDSVPAEAFALLFGDFLENGERLRAVVLAAGGKDGVDERDRSSVRGSEGSGFNGC